MKQLSWPPFLGPSLHLTPYRRLPRTTIGTVRLPLQQKQFRQAIVDFQSVGGDTDSPNLILPWHVALLPQGIQQAINDLNRYVDLTEKARRNPNRRPRAHSDGVLFD